MDKRKALYPGTFDPFTKGHFSIVERALGIFDEVTILIAVPPIKKPFLSVEQRIEMISEIYKDDPRVKINFWPHLVADYAEQNQIKTMIRGLRPTGDFETEFQMAQTNKHLFPKVETIFFMTSEDNYYISSTVVREVLHHGRDVTPFVHPIIAKHLSKIRGEK